MRGITDPSLAQAKLSWLANPQKYARDFDATVEYLLNQVVHHQMNQQLNIAADRQGTAGTLHREDDKGQDLNMLAVLYSKEQWAKMLLFTEGLCEKALCTQWGWQVWL